VFFERDTAIHSPKPELLEPGKVYEYRIDMWQTGITVPVGAKLRV